MADIAPVLEGVALTPACWRLPFGGLDMTKQLQRLLLDQNTPLSFPEAAAVKEATFRVAADSAEFNSILKGK
jgi:actin-related protein